MDERTLRQLEFNEVKARAAEHASTNAGKEAVLGLAPSGDAGEVSRGLARTAEALDIIHARGSAPFGGIRDIRGHVERAGRAGLLNPAELLEVAGTARAGRQLRRFIEAQAAPLLLETASRIGSFTELEDKVDHAITSEGDVADDATPELARLRRTIRTLQGRIRDKLESLVRSPEYAKVLQEPIITIRRDRYVVPVRQEARQQLPGIVHDQSASGATLFVEPLAVVNLGNDLRQLELKEAAEEEAVLRHLTALVAAVAGPLAESVAALAELDAVFAKARYGEEIKGTIPILNQRGYLSFEAGRHPLLTGEVVPVDVNLGKAFDTLVLTGPNTGGKTVTLKTIGLFALMTQAGIPLPATRGCEMTVFADVACDIGDEQSIQQSLSTFSSHMRNVVAIAARAAPGTLVLLDEIGAGTDPTEGAALAMALLEHFHASGALTVATTHYSELKTFAYTRPRVENACVEFDTESLRPTFRLLIGIPGRSNAMEISARLGLKGEIIDRARQFLTREEVQIDTLLGQIEADRVQLERERREAEVIRGEVARLRDQYAKARAELDARERETIERARSEAASLLRKVKLEAEAAGRELRRARTAESSAEAQRAIAEARRRLRAAAGDIAAEAWAGDPAQEPIDGPVPDRLVPGETVYLRHLRQKATVLAAPGADGDALVQAGILKLHVPLKEMTRIAAPASPRELPGAAGTMGTAKAQTFSPELDLRGETVEDALFRTEKYLDDAYLSGIRQVRLIHGKGTGALRRGVADFLKGHPQVASARLGAQGEGGDGVTIVELRE